MSERDPQGRVRDRGSRRPRRLRGRSCSSAARRAGSSPGTSRSRAARSSPRTGRCAERWFGSGGRGRPGLRGPRARRGGRSRADGRRRSRRPAESRSRGSMPSALAAGQLPEIAHWIAPPEVPVRFDARFFALEAPDRLALRPDGSETADAWWMSPRALLEDWEAGRRRLYWPTYFTVSAIAPCASRETTCSPCTSRRGSPTRRSSSACPARPSGRTASDPRRARPRAEPRRLRARGDEHVDRRETRRRS